MDFEATLEQFTDTYTEPCESATDWMREQVADGKTFAEMWQECERPDWMLWLAYHVGIERKVRVTIACRIVRETKLHDGRTVWDLLTDERSRNAVETAEKWVNGEATDDQLRAAAAAYAAYAADAAAAAAAYAAAYAAAAADAAAYAAAAAAAAADAAAAAADAAAYAAYAAYAAAAAADAAADARQNACKQGCDIVREAIQFADIETRLAPVTE